MAPPRQPHVTVDRHLVTAALDGRPLSWLARRVGVGQEHLGRALNGRQPMTLSLWQRIRAALPSLPEIAPNPLDNT